MKCPETASPSTHIYLVAGTKALIPVDSIHKQGDPEIMAMNKTDQGLDKGHQQNFPGNQGAPDKGNRPDDQRKQDQNPNQGGQFNQGRPGDRANQGDKGGDRGNQPNR
jgi:hypothetical protein